MNLIKWPYTLYKNDVVVFEGKITHKKAWGALMDGKCDKTIMNTRKAIEEIKAEAANLGKEKGSK